MKELIKYLIVILTMSFYLAPDWQEFFRDKGKDAVQLICRFVGCDYTVLCYIDDAHALACIRNLLKNRPCRIV